MKPFILFLLSITLFFSFSCNQEEEELIYDYQYRCGDFYAEGELEVQNYSYCGIVHKEGKHFYKKGYWKFYDAKGIIIATANFYPIKFLNEENSYPFSLIEVTTSDLKNYSNKSDSIILSKIENCFSVELENGKSKLLQEKETAEILNFN